MSVPTPPDWLNKEFVERCLRQGLQDDELSIREIKLEPASAAGDNYGSQMFRGTIKITKNRSETEELSTVMKILPKADYMKESMDMEEFFRVESLMFSQVLPTLPGLTNKVIQKFFANSYYVQQKPTPLIMLEDLRPRGFVLGDRRNGLDLEHCMLVVKSLATLHASSYVLLEQKPELKEHLSTSLYCPENAVFLQKFIVSGVKALREAAEKWDEFPKSYVEKLSKLEETILPKTYRVYDRNGSKLKVIVHGDAWPGNMLFRYNEDRKPVEIALVDFQCSNYNNPTLDLNYFLFNGPKQEVRDKHLEFLLELYHQKFTEVLLKLNHAINYSFDELKKDFYEHLDFGLMTAISIHPLTTAPPELASAINDILDKGSDSSECGILENNVLYRKVILEMLKFFERYGAF